MTVVCYSLSEKYFRLKLTFYDDFVRPHTLCVLIYEKDGVKFRHPSMNIVQHIKYNSCLLQCYRLMFELNQSFLLIHLQKITKICWADKSSIKIDLMHHTFYINSYMTWIYKERNQFKIDLLKLFIKCNTTLSSPPSFNKNTLFIPFCF